MVQGVIFVSFPILFFSHQEHNIREVAGKTRGIDMFYDLQINRIHGDNERIDFGISCLAANFFRNKTPAPKRSNRIYRTHGVRQQRTALTVVRARLLRRVLSFCTKKRQFVCGRSGLEPATRYYFLNVPEQILPVV